MIQKILATIQQQSMVLSQENCLHKPENSFWISPDIKKKNSEETEIIHQNLSNFIDV